MNENRLPVPSGAVAGDWDEYTGVPGGRLRFITWSQHAAAGVVVAVEGTQYADGQLTAPSIWLHDDVEELTAADARRVAAVLLDAADALEMLR